MEMKKSKHLWREEDHPRDELGKFTDKRFIPTPEEKKILKQKILSFEPIKLKIADKEITAEFDKFCAQKNAYNMGNSDNAGYEYKFKNVDKLRNDIGNSTYLKSKKEKGKDKIQHKGVIVWHYFVGKIETENETLNMVVNVRDKGENRYIYEISFKK